VQCRQESQVLKPTYTWISHLFPLVCAYRHILLSFWGYNVDGTLAFIDTGTGDDQGRMSHPLAPASFPHSYAIVVVFLNKTMEVRMPDNSQSRTNLFPFFYIGTLVQRTV